MQIKLQFSLTKPALIQDWVAFYLFIYLFILHQLPFFIIIIFIL